MQTYEVGIPFPLEEQLTHEEKKSLLDCEWCANKCYNIFMKVHLVKGNIKNYCSPHCWHEGREVVYHELSPKKKGNLSTK